MWSDTLAWACSVREKKKKIESSIQFWYEKRYIWSFSFIGFINFSELDHPDCCISLISIHSREIQRKLNSFSSPLKSNRKSELSKRERERGTWNREVPPERDFVWEGLMRWVCFQTKTSAHLYSLFGVVARIARIWFFFFFPLFIYLYIYSLLSFHTILFLSENFLSSSKFTICVSNFLGVWTFFLVKRSNIPSHILFYWVIITISWS